MGPIASGSIPIYWTLWSSQANLRGILKDGGFLYLFLRWEDVISGLVGQLGRRSFQISLEYSNRRSYDDQT